MREPRGRHVRIFRSCMPGSRGSSTWPYPQMLFLPQKSTDCGKRREREGREKEEEEGRRKKNAILVTCYTRIEANS